MFDQVLGIDVGGTKIAAGVVASGGRCLSRGQIATDPREPPDAAVARVVELCRDVARAAGVELSRFRIAGLGVPGPSDVKTGMVVSPPNLQSWWGYPLGPKLSGALGARVVVENDANAAALAEHRFGAGQGVANLVYLTLSTGVGSGVIAEGRLYVGQGYATELGHASVDFRGRRCRCGGRGCLEALASGTALVELAHERLAAGERSLLSAHGAALTAEHLVAAVRQGDGLAAAVWEEALDALAAGLGNAINIFNPQRIILGGGLTRARELLFAPLRERAPKRALAPLAEGVELLPAGLEDDVGILGAAAVAFAALA